MYSENYKKMVYHYFDTMILENKDKEISKFRILLDENYINNTHKNVGVQLKD